MKKIYLLIACCFLTACTSVTPPSTFTYKEIQTDSFKIATWQKITNPNGTYRVYIEGDGKAFNARGKPTANPTPSDTLVREMAFEDPADNVIYVARPCQFVSDTMCNPAYWSIARFAPEAVSAEANAIKSIVGSHKVVLIGYSGGAQMAGLIAVQNPSIKVQKIVTVAGVLDHKAWTQAHNVLPLIESQNLKTYHRAFDKIPQVHYVGDNDTIVPPTLTQESVGNKKTIKVVQNATHNRGWSDTFKEIWAER